MQQLRRKERKKEPVCLQNGSLTFCCIGLLRPNVEKSKSSGFSVFSPVFSKKLLSSFLDRNLFPDGPMINTSYLPAEAPLFLCDTFLFQPDGSV